ncbi:Fe-S cluster assembly protein SufD [Mariprofundus micogutta]|uniref:Fe-S cluster assembly protein SufD n=1 Tax=Mariprofundus micogutta TaxID=1921010 RepID=A0A1L8CMW6_9PROT|nr:Fe-S cluster assembly protein SufD [Mariprofundus micogutta]GAV20234.1 Fe-S cluster assembly protein SufD [Mariprofundus micogutta]
MSASLQQVRETAWQAFEQQGLPTTRDEDWKYTDLSRISALLGEQWWQTVEQGELDVTAADIPELDAWRMVFINGHFDSETSELPAGITVTALSALIQDDPDRSVELLEFEPDAPLSSGMTAANSALAIDGACICVSDNTKLDKPLYIQYVSNGGTSHLRTGIQLGKHAEIEVIEHFVGHHAESGLTNHVTAIRLAAGASCTHYRLQLEAAKQCHAGRVEVNQLADSSYTLHAVELGGLLSRSDVINRLNASGASCHLNGLFVLASRQHADHHTRIEHNAPHCKSRENYRAVLDGRSHGVFNGKIVVAEGAVKTDSAQSNANLLLSSNAEIDTKPELEIYNDDVKCAHGVTVGQLDKNQLFYLTTRGISEEEAKQMLTFAFADEILAKMENKAVRRFIEKEAFSKLPNITDLEGMLA